MADDQKIADNGPVDPDYAFVTFPCLRAKQPIGDLFIAVVKYQDLERISWFDVRRRLQEDRDVERYLGIQRPLDPRRVDSLKEYVNFADASFPTSIILAIDEDYVQFMEDKSTMTISNTRDGENTPSIAIRNAARVLDGQHRIAGLEGFKGETFELAVTIFVGADISDQAQIFATVNLEQNKVNKSLVYDLYELARSRSPQKTCHNITVALDRDKDSPLYRRIKRLGKGTEGRTFEPIAQATFVEGIMPYISVDPRRDRDILLREQRLSHVAGNDLAKTPLRNLFIEEKDIKITQIFYNYFSAVSRKWRLAWDTRESGFILNRTNGVRALFRFFRSAYEKTARPGEVPTTDNFLKDVFEEIPLESGHFNVDNFLPGTSGETRLVRILRGEEGVENLILRPTGQ
jgi:DGQHR domain-containing protein